MLYLSESPQINEIAEKYYFEKADLIRVLFVIYF